MIRTAGCALIGAALLAAGGAAATPVLEVRLAGETVARLPLGPEGAFCLHWRHSVTGGAVVDCFAAGDRGLQLQRSYLHDFAAGLGHVPGRGVQRAAAGGGYWIEGIDAPLPGGALRLRVGGAAVGHRIETPGGAVLELSALAAGRRVMLALVLPDD